MNCPCCKGPVLRRSGKLFKYCSRACYLRSKTVIDIASVVQMKTAGMTYKQMAQIIPSTAGSIRVALQRARRAA